MTVEQVTGFFLWTSIINLGMMVLIAILFMAAGDWVCRLHGKIWGIPPEKIRAIVYRVMAMYKILVFLLCVFPYVAMRIVTG
jgi:hypothetical protein